jgi:hypothetical protein
VVPDVSRLMLRSRAPGGPSEPAAGPARLPHRRPRQLRARGPS